MRLKENRGDISLIVILVVVVLVLGAGVYLFFQGDAQINNSSTPTPTTYSNTPAPTDQEYVGWSLFSSKKLGITLKYPTDEVYLKEEASSKGINYVSYISRKLETQIENGVDLPTASIGSTSEYVNFDKLTIAKDNWESPSIFFKALEELTLGEPTVIKGDLDIRFVEYTKLSESAIDGRKAIKVSAKPTAQSATGAYPKYFVYVLDNDRLIVSLTVPNTDSENNSELSKKIINTLSFMH